MANRDILAIGTSAGGVEALMQLVKGLEPELRAMVLVTIHLPATYRSSLDELLSKSGPLPAHFAEHGEEFCSGRICIAPPNRHLLVDGEKLWLGAGARENYARPSVDVMFRSAAVCCGGRMIGVILTGTLGDGASGLWTAAQCGAITVVQDPRSAAFAGMPDTALERVQADHIVDLPNMALLLNELVHQPACKTLPAPRGAKLELAAARSGDGDMAAMDEMWRRSLLSCPECQGVMWEIDEGQLVRYRCHAGHAFTDEVMSAALDESLSKGIATAKRVLEERVMLAQRLHKQAIENGHPLTAATWVDRIAEYQVEMETVVKAILRIEAIAASSQLAGGKGAGPLEPSCKPAILP